jgi:hypothetical protein
MSISTANIEEVDRSSPDPSISSITRYLESSANEDGSPPIALSSDERGRHHSKYLPPSMRRPTSQRSASLADSSASMSSISSLMSDASFKSVDHRGARRGRKRWTGTQTEMPHFDAPKVPEMIQLDIDSDASKSRKWTAKTLIFCTWPECDKTFKNRSEWARHEEATHYCPYNWVCCLDSVPSPLETIGSCFFCGSRNVSLKHVTQHRQFSSCVSENPKHRSFLRKDHLVQHITAKHVSFHKRNKAGPAFLEKLVSRWKTRNPLMQDEALYCGFCGFTFPDWEARQVHVFDHLNSSLNTGLAYKSSWSSGRDYWHEGRWKRI